MLAQAKARIALLHDDESMQRALSIQTKAKRMLAVAASSEEVKQLQAQSQGMSVSFFFSPSNPPHNCVSVVGEDFEFLPRAMCHGKPILVNLFIRGTHKLISQWEPTTRPSHVGSSPPFLVVYCKLCTVESKDPEIVPRLLFKGVL